jgi:hypothetical protein
MVNIIPEFRSIFDVQGIWKGMKLGLVKGWDYLTSEAMSTKSVSTTIIPFF